MDQNLDTSCDRDGAFHKAVFCKTTALGFVLQHVSLIVFVKPFNSGGNYVNRGYAVWPDLNNGTEDVLVCFQVFETRSTWVSFGARKRDDQWAYLGLARNVAKFSSAEVPAQSSLELRSLHCAKNCWLGPWDGLHGLSQHGYGLPPSSRSVFGWRSFHKFGFGGQGRNATTCRNSNR